ncbi:hypothetical protein B0H21DRAFT_738326 [Amylocystis lapponica]|nr:hypothetical protein B0H21DRAFT_738326 [Amylocystis lapponica]
MSSVLRSLLVLLRSLRSSSLFQIPKRRILLLWLGLKRLLRYFGWLRLARRGDPDLPSPEPKQVQRISNESKRAVIYPSMEPSSSLGLHYNSNSPSRLLHPTDIPSRPHSSAYSMHTNGTGTLHPYSFSVRNPSRSFQDIAVTSISDYGHYPHGGEHRVARRRSRASARGLTGMASATNSRTISRSSSRSRSRPPSVVSRASPLPSVSRLPMAVGMPALRGLHSPAYPESSLAAPTSRSPALATVNIATPSTQSLPLPSVDEQPSPARSPAPASLDTSKTSPAHSPVVYAADYALPLHVLPPPPMRQRIHPVTQTQRYDRNIVIPSTEEECFIEPMTLLFPLENVPAQWCPCVHPEGALYFAHKEKRIFTDANLRDPHILAIIEVFCHTVYEEAAELGFVLPDNTDLVLELESDGEGGYDWCYYFADHTHRTLFWLHRCDITYDIGFIKGVSAPAHIKHDMENFYWMHYEAFPHNREPPADAVNEVMSTLLHASIDQLTSQTSTATYTSAQLHEMLGLMREAQGHNSHTVCVVARLMQIFAHLKFINFHGQYGARLSRDQSVHGETEQRRTLLISLLSPLFFNAPDIHLRSLEKLWVDGLINRLPWGNFIGRMQSDWQEFILYATVMLNANVAFLTIPDVDPGGGKRTAAQIASFISIVTSIGSIILGLLLVRQHRVKPRETAHEAVEYLLKQKHPTLGLETLAILYSLPYALLMWAMVSFLLAFAFECFVKRDGYSTFTTLVAWIMVGILIFWCIYTAWDSDGVESSTWLLLCDIWDHASTTAHKVRTGLRWNTFHTKQPGASAVSGVHGDTV